MKTWTSGSTSYLGDPAIVADPGAVLGTIDHPRCRWATVNEALRDPGRLPPLLPEDQPIGDVFRRWMIYTRGDKHHQLRRRFSGYFGPQQAESFRANIEKRVDEVLEAVAPRGEMDLVTDLAQRITFPLICDTMGVPDSDREELARLILVFEEAVPRQRDPYWAKQGEAAGAQIMDTFEGYLAHRRAQPQHDFLTDLVRSSLGDQEEWRDVAANCMFLLSNAFSNTPTLVAGTIGLLLDHPDTLTSLRGGDVTLDQVVEESARLLSPVTYTLSADAHDDERWSTYYLAAANRDPQEFVQPDDFDPARTPNRHLTFFVGQHACLGSSVAKLITGVTALRVMEGLAGLRRAGPPVWTAARPLHRLGHLPVEWDRAPSSDRN